MKNKIFNLVAKFTAIATILASVMTVSPASAASATSMKDTMSTLTASATSVTHAVTMTLPAGYTNGNVSLTYTASFASFAFTSGTCTGGTVVDNTTAANVVNVTLSGCTAGGPLTINFTGTNTSTLGSNKVVISSSTNLEGQYAVVIVDSDQVSVTATVDPSITFDIDTGASSGETAAPYTVPLNTLSAGSVSTGTNHIFLDLDTNATGGAVVTVKGSSTGLTSVAASHTITTAGGPTALAAGTEGFGLCVNGTSAVVGTVAAASPFNGSCAADTVGGITTSPQNIINTAGAPVDGTANNTADILVKAAISVVTQAATDYSETLTFVATGTF